MVRRVLFVALALLVIAGAWFAGLVFGLYGSHRGPGETAATPLPAPVLVARAGAEKSAARAIEEPSVAVKGAELRCSYDGDGNCIDVEPCYGDFRTQANDDCLAMVEERAWSSPIFVDRAK